MASRYSTVDKTDWSSTDIRRAGIVPIIHYNNELWYGFTLSNITTSLSDYGGSVTGPSDEERDYDALDTALREWDEESQGIFGPVTAEQLSNCYVLEYEYSRTILYYIESDKSPWDYITEYVAKSEDEEISTITFMTRQQILNASRNRDVSFPLSGERVVNINVYIAKPITRLFSKVTEQEIIARAAMEPVEFIRPPRLYREDKWVTIRNRPVDFRQKNKFGFNIFITGNNRQLAIGSEKKIVYIYTGRMFNEYDRKLSIGKASYMQRPFVALDGDPKMLRAKSVESLIRDVDPSQVPVYINLIWSNRDSSKTLDEKMVQEIAIMNEYEALMYEIQRRSGGSAAVGARMNVRSPLRHCFIDNFNVVSEMISRSDASVSAGDAAIFLQIEAPTCGSLTIHGVIALMTDVGLLVQDGDYLDIA